MYYRTSIQQCIKKMSKLVHIFFLIVFFLFSSLAMAIDEPSYEVLNQESPFEVRQYSPILIAEVLVDGSMDEASNKGFRMIADFIFGNNIGVDQRSNKIAMTAPVTLEPQKIAMTAPVTVEKADASQWRVQFVMPKEYTLETLPKPNNKNVNIREVTGKRYAVIRYSGSNSSDKFEKRTQELMQWIEAKHFKVIGTPQLARYNPPWTLPPWRRNEVLIEIEP
jgi:hypothetical protein